MSMRTLLFVLAAAPLAAQTQPLEEGARQLWNSEFRASRPAPARPAPAEAKTPAANSTLVGITVWMVGDTATGDRGEVRMTRIEAESPLKEGQKVRIGIESARAGYLYVIDREEYADGRHGKPYLIFPTLRTLNGDNRVRAGRLIEVPGVNDSPRYFTIRMSRPDQVAEVLTLLVTPEPLAEVKVARDPAPLDEQQVERWSKQWGARVRRLASGRDVGTAYTRAERDAAGMSGRLLTHDDPLPQTMYRVEAKPGAPLLVRVPLRIAK